MIVAIMVMIIQVLAHLVTVRYSPPLDDNDNDDDYNDYDSGDNSDNYPGISPLGDSQILSSLLETSALEQ